MKIVLTSLFVTTLFFVHAQVKLVPGKKSFEGKWIANSSYEMRWYALKDTARMEIGQVKTRISTDKKQLSVITTVEMKNMKNPWVDTTLADGSTLRPIYHSSFNMQRDMVLNFGKVVTGYYNDKVKGNTIQVVDTTREAYFDSNLYPQLLAWLPLREGYKQDIAIYDYNPAGKKGVINASITAVTSGKYSSMKSGEREVWVVTVTDEIGSGNSVSTYYFDKADRKIWKQEIVAGNRKMLMQRVE